MLVLDTPVILAIHIAEQRAMTTQHCCHARRGQQSSYRGKRSHSDPCIATKVHRDINFVCSLGKSGKAWQARALGPAIAVYMDETTVSVEEMKELSSDLSTLVALLAILPGRRQYSVSEDSQQRCP